MPTATDIHEAVAWREHAYKLVQWTMQRLAVRTDCYGHYPDRGPDDPCVEPEIVASALTERRLAKHYGATSRSGIVGIAAIGADGMSRWMLIGLRRRGDGDVAATPGLNFDIALRWHDRLHRLGFHPILEDSDGQGGYRLITLFDEPAPAAKVHAFAQKITVDWADAGLTEPPRIVPGAPGGDGEPGWMRLPGLHPLGQHASRVWDGERWLSGGEAVAALLRTRATPPMFMREHGPPPVKEKVVALAPGRAVELPRASTSEPRPRPRPRPQPQPPQTRTLAPTPSLPTPNPEDPMNTTMSRPAVAPTPPTNGQGQVSPADLFPAPAADLVARIADRTGMRESEIVRRLFEWFSGQDEVVQALVLGQIPAPLRPNANQLLVERLTSQS